MAEGHVGGAGRVTIEWARWWPGSPGVRHRVELVLAVGERASVVAHHSEMVDGEDLGTVTARPGTRSFTAAGSDGATTEPLDLLVGVETDRAEPLEAYPAGSGTAGPIGSARRCGVRRRQHRARVRGGSGGGPDPSFGDVVAPAPPHPRAARCWPGTAPGAASPATWPPAPSRSWKDLVAGVAVINPEPARGGRDLEPMAAVLRRGPNEFLTVRRAVTAADYELLAAQSSGGVAQAQALTRADVWSLARPGEVEVVLVPHLPDGPQRRQDRQRVAAGPPDRRGPVGDPGRELDRRRPLGTRCVVGWAQYKPVSVRARVVVGAEEDVARVQERPRQPVSGRSSAAAGAAGGWRFGQALRRSNVYRLEQAEPGVQWVEEVPLRPRRGARRADQRLAPTATSRRPGSRDPAVLFRSTNDADGWEPVGRFGSEVVGWSRPTPEPTAPGSPHDPASWRSPPGPESVRRLAIHVSDDLGAPGGWSAGSTSASPTSPGPARAAPKLLVATDRGLYELPLIEGAAPTPVLVDAADPDRASTASRRSPTTGASGGSPSPRRPSTASTSRAEAGRPGSWTNVGLTGSDTRTLAVQHGARATGCGPASASPNPTSPVPAPTEPACSRPTSGGSRLHPAGGGTCWALAFTANRVFAASQNGGVLRLELNVAEPSWEALDVNAGLPLRRPPRFEPVEKLGRSPSRRVDGRRSGGRAAQRRRGPPVGPGLPPQAEEVVTIPGTWLLCSGRHEIEVVSGRAPRALERLLPTMYQLAARPGSPLDAALWAMEDLHAPDEALLDRVETVFDPYRCPDAFVPWLTRWVGLDWLVDEGDDAGPGWDDPADAFPPGLHRLREGGGHRRHPGPVAGHRGRPRPVPRAATGVEGWTITEPADHPFHIVVTAGPRPPRGRRWCAGSSRPSNRRAAPPRSGSANPSPNPSRNQNQSPDPSPREQPDVHVAGQRLRHRGCARRPGTGGGDLPRHEHGRDAGPLGADDHRPRRRRRVVVHRRRAPAPGAAEGDGELPVQGARPGRHRRRYLRLAGGGLLRRPRPGRDLHRQPPSGDHGQAHERGAAADAVVALRPHRRGAADGDRRGAGHRPRRRRRWRTEPQEPAQDHRSRQASACWYRRRRGHGRSPTPSWSSASSGSGAIAAGADCEPIDGETAASYQVVEADTDHTLRVEVTATDGEDTASNRSEPLGPVDPVPLTNTVPPAINGTPVVAQVLTATTGSWSEADTDLDFAFQWERCDASGVELRRHSVRPRPPTRSSRTTMARGSP